MQIEYEATFANINKDEVRNRLKVAGAELIRSEFMQKRRNFNLPKGNEIAGGWMRVRNEGDKITMSLKVVNDNLKIDDQKEICLNVDSFENAQDFLMAIGCTKKAYQESKRELWNLDGVEICIDEWPYLEPFVEIEGSSEEAVKRVTEKLGFDYAKALFGAVDAQYEMKYGISKKTVNNEVSEITFDDENPFLKFVK